MSDMASQGPLVSIGLPVYNGAAHLSEALDSLLAQDYERIELVISDNASTDDTPTICQKYAAIDSRIRYYRKETTSAVIPNFRRALDLSSGDYFVWAAHDDTW